MLVGKAEKNAAITMHIMPVYKVTPSSNNKPVLLNGGKLYKQQDFTIAADAAGNWQSPMIEVKFDSKVTDRKIHVFLAQEWEGGQSKGKVIAFPAEQKIKMIISAPLEKKAEKKALMTLTAKPKRPLKITSHTDGQDAHGQIQILGTGEPGATVTIDLYAYAEVTPKKKGTWEVFKNIVLPPGTYDAVNEALLKNTAGTQIKERFFKTYTSVIDPNGKWYIPVFPSFGSPNWMRNAFIPFAWLVSASTIKDPNYQDGNVVRMRLGCKL